jgi:hypothetical protein
MLYRLVLYRLVLYRLVLYRLVLYRSVLKSQSLRGKNPHQSLQSLAANAKDAVCDSVSRHVVPKWC